MTKERTTVSAESAHLAVLRDEARRRSVPLSTVLAEAIAEAARRLHQSRRPRFGLANSGTGAAQASEGAPDEAIEAHPYRS